MTIMSYNSYTDVYSIDKHICLGELHSLSALVRITKKKNNNKPQSKQTKKSHAAYLM